MSRLFAAASSQYMSNAGPAVTAYPFTVSLWVKPTTISGTHIYWWNGDTGGNTDYWFVGMEATTGKPTIGARNIGVSVSPPGLSGMTAGTWYNIIAVFNSATDRRIYLNNDAGVQDTTNVTTPASIDAVALGRLHRASPNFYADARIAHCAVWSTALGSSDRAQLAGGGDPRNVSVGSLIDYWKLTTNASPEPDSIGSLSMTLAGAAPTYSSDDPTVSTAATKTFTLGGTIATEASKTFTVGGYIANGSSVQKHISGKITTDDGSYQGYVSAIRYPWLEIGTGVAASTSGEIQLTATDALLYHAQRQHLDYITSGNYVVKTKDCVISADLHNVGANNGNARIGLYQVVDITKFYDISIAPTAGGTSATTRANTNQATVAKGIANGATKRVKYSLIGATSKGIVDGSAIASTTDGSPFVGPFDIRLGAPNNGLGTSDWRFDNIDFAISNTITVRGVPTGGSVRLYDATDAVIAQGTETGNVVTLDASAVPFPITGYIRVFTDSAYTTQATQGVFPQGYGTTTAGYATSSEIRGGDEYYFGAPYAVIASEFNAFYATTQVTSHNGSMINGDMAYGVAIGRNGSVLAWAGSISRNQFYTYEIAPVNTISDHHASCDVVVDSSGYFHMIYGGYNATQAVYVKSSSPWSIDGWSAGTNLGTQYHLSLLIDQADTLYALGTGPNAGLTNKKIVAASKASGGSWSAFTTIADAATGWTYYFCDAAIGKQSSGQKTIQATFFAYDGAGTYKDCIFIRCTDGNIANWKGLTGVNFTLPLTQNVTTGAISDINAVAHTGSVDYVSRIAIDTDNVTVHMVLWDLTLGYPRYFKGTTSGGWAAPSQSFSGLSNHSLGAIEQTSAGLVYVGTGINPNILKRWRYTTSLAAWSAAETMILGTTSYPPEWYWVKLTPGATTDSVKALFQSRSTGYVSDGSSNSGQGVAALYLADVQTVLSSSFTISGTIILQPSATMTLGGTLVDTGVKTFTIGGMITERATATFTIGGQVDAPAGPVPALASHNTTAAFVGQGNTTAAFVGQGNTTAPFVNNRDTIATFV